MTVEQQRKILEHIVSLERDINELKRVRIEVGLTGYSSATISSSGGSKSYTRIDIDKISTLINLLTKELAQYMNMLNYGKAKTLTTIETVYS